MNNDICDYYKKYPVEGCGCGNDPYEPGECLYDKGKLIQNAAILCKKYKVKREQSDGEDETSSIKIKAELKI